MSMIQSDLLLGQEGGGGYTIPRSLRFNSSDSAFLSRVPSSAGNRKTWTWAGWVKRSVLGNDSFFGVTSGSYFNFYFASTNAIQFDINGYYYTTSSVYRDPSAWYHLVLTIDTTQATAANRARLYVNGVEVFLTSPIGAVPQNTDTIINSTTEHRLGAYSTNYFDGYLADIHFIDGQALTPSSFGEFDANNVWQPKAYTGSYGTNGFHLDFADNSAATAAALGKDTSGNGNNWTPNNLSVTGQSGLGYPQGLTAGSGSVTNPTLAFDGNTNTVAVAGSSSTITFTPPTPISFASKLEFWTTNGQGPGYNDQRYSYNGGAEVNCAGGEWTTVVTGSGTLTSLAIRNTLNTISRLSAVRIDNSILIYNNGAGNDSLVDSPSQISGQTDSGAGGTVVGNYCTWNPLGVSNQGSVAWVLSDGNLVASDAASNIYGTVPGTMAVSSGKWYWEVTVSLGLSGIDAYQGIGVESAALTDARNPWTATKACYYLGNGQKVVDATTPSAYGTAWSLNDTVGVALNMDANTVTFYLNNASQGSISISPNGASYRPAVGDYNNGKGSVFTANFGQRQWAYAAPAGFKALCTANLPTPTIANGATAMDVKLYTGNDSTQAVTGLLFSPDLVWTKCRSFPLSHIWMDAVRGTGVYLRSNNTGAEESNANVITSFDSAGFTLGSSSAANLSPETYAAWCWDAGSSTVSNTQGSITSQVRANASAGFSIVTYTGTGSSLSFGHGLGVSPALVIIKQRSADNYWAVGHSYDWTKILYLNTTDSAGGGTTAWSSAPSSTVINLGASGYVNVNNGTFVAYCFAPVSGYSAFGSYTGNGSSDGPFVYTGFRPRWILVKSSSLALDWCIFDAARDGYNAENDSLYPNSSQVENNFVLANELDILSNGFKPRANRDRINQSSATYIYVAFAESSINYSRAR